MTLGLAGIAGALVFVGLTLLAVALPAASLAGIPLAAGAVGGAGLATWAGLQLSRWPAGKLALFRDRLLVIQGNREMRALWSQMETITLAAPAAWPDVRLTDRLTIHLKNEAPLVFKPATFGLAPAACRDLILRLRDDPKLRQRLPEFDSARDLAISPVVAGEHTEPHL